MLQGFYFLLLNGIAKISLFALHLQASYLQEVTSGKQLIYEEKGNDEEFVRIIQICL